MAFSYKKILSNGGTTNPIFTGIYEGKKWWCTEFILEFSDPPDLLKNLPLWDASVRKGGLKSADGVEQIICSVFENPKPFDEGSSRFLFPDLTGEFPKGVVLIKRGDVRVFLDRYFVDYFKMRYKHIQLFSGESDLLSTSTVIIKSSGLLGKSVGLIMPLRPKSFEKVPDELWQDFDL